MPKSEQHTGRDVFAVFMNEFMNEGDRACIILASAEMEARFQLLFEKLLGVNSRLKKELFGFTGPLGAFSARVKMAYALKIITKDFFDLLEAFRSLRNKIVHKGVHASLKDPDVSKASQSILRYFRESKKFKKWAFAIEGMDQEQSEFRHALSFMILMIEHTTEFLEPTRITPHSCDPEEFLLDRETPKEADSA
jgi:DNA-binding MltR family transcriptional regulator